ncbi:Imm52 family immunity protein [Streptomyces sp. NPDC048604]|uniref:Imm52 family immunity protein n=1 Tax=Streptomyces sp. NPDC048604 TaxID=3365578 RepID=UPI00371EE4A1
MRRVVVRAFWGPREETVEELAARWARTLDRVTRLLPPQGGGAWTLRRVGGSGAAAVVTPDEESLAAALRAVQAADDWSSGSGTDLRLLAEDGLGRTLELGGRAGAAAEFVLMAMLLTVRVPEDEELPYPELLTALAEAWSPDFGGVVDDDVLDTLEDDGDFAPSDPAIGWAGYLSPARATLVPRDFPAGAEPLSTGGALLDVASPDDTAAVLRANLLLRTAGALQPLPRPMDRPQL